MAFNELICFRSYFMQCVFDYVVFWNILMCFQICCNDCSVIMSYGDVSERETVCKIKIVFQAIANAYFGSCQTSMMKRFCESS